MEPPLNPDLVVQSLNFHGQQLQKLWESERGEDDLSKVNVNSKEIDFEIYQQRQKQLSFQDRGKRLKLQQFIVKKATSLFELSLSETTETVKDRTQNDDVSDCYAVMPPYEAFIDLDKQSRLRHFLENLQRGDVVFCSIVSKSVSGLMLKVLCSDGEQQRYVSDINVKAFCPMSSMIPAADKKSVTRNYLVNDTVCCEVLEVMPDTEKLVVGMKGFALPPDSEYSCRLGLVTSEDFPEMYKKTQDMKGESYQKVLEKTLGFYNPNNINYLANLLGLGSTNYSHMTGMRGRFPEQEYASELRQIQASKWAFRSVAEGIEHFKSGRHSEAFQCLNKALNIDPRNVEGLVARGALYANSGSFQKAIEDFETALKLNPNHQNARKYAGETLVALGRSYEDENKFDEALKAYQNCLSLIPFHEEAQNSIEYLKNKILNSSKLSDSEVTIPGLNSSKSAEVKETLKQLLKSNEEEEKKEKEKSKSKKKKERKSRKRRHRSSSSSSTSSSASSRSSSSSSSSSSDSSSASSRSGSHSRSRSPSRSRKSSKKHRKSSKKKEDKRDKSLSPLSKRMALMDPSSEVEGLGGLLAQRVSHYNPPAVPFSFTPFQVVQDTSMQKSYEKDDYEQRVCRFLEQTKGDSEYEEKVRKFLEESARWKKERKAQEEKSKKKKKKEKKSRDKEKNKKKKREREEHEKKKKHRSKRSDKFDIKDFEEQMESKKFRDAIRKELTVKEETRKRKSIDDEEEFLYGSGSDKKDLRLLGLENLPDLEDLESKLSAYYAKVEKDTGLSKRSEEKVEKEKKRHSSSPGKNKHASPKVVFVHNEEAKAEETLRAREKKKMDMFADSPSPPANSKEKATPESATVMPSKWKIQIGSTNTRIKKKDKSQIEKEPWDEIEEKRFIFLKDNDKEGSEDEADIRKKKQPEEKFSTRKSRETAEKIVQEKPKKESSEESREDSVAKTQQFMDKFQSGFRINSSRSSEKKSDELPPLPPGMPPKTSFTISGRGKTTPVLANSSSQPKGPRTDSDTDSNASEKRKKKKSQQPQPQQQQPTPTSQQTPTAASSSAGPGRRLSSGESSRSRSRSRTKYSRASSSNSSRSRSRSYPKNRNRSKSASYDGRRSRSASYARYGSRSRSRSYYRSSASRSRSRSYRSRSRSYDRYSRSRSRSEDYRRRSRSESDDRRRRHDYHMNKFQGRYPRNRGTYYRPRFQSNYKNQRGGSNFANRGNRNFHQKYGPGRGNRPFNNRGRGRGRPRFFHYKPSSGYRDYHSRRYEGRPRSRSSDGRRSYSREDDDPMKKVDAAKEKINKYIAEENKKDDAQAASSKSRDEPLSEGEAVDDDDYGLPPLPPGGPPSRESSYVDRKSYEGKWAEKDSEEKGSRSRGSEGPRLPPENSIEEMDKFLNKVKGQKKDDSKERSKSFGKSSSNW